MSQAPEPAAEGGAQGSALDADTRAALEWDTLLAAIGSLCRSSAGKARALSLCPCATLDEARARNQVVAEMLDVDRLGLAPPARAFPDVSEALERACRGGVASAAELWQVRELLELSAELRVFARGQREAHAALAACIDSPAELSGLEDDLSQSIDPDGTVRSGGAVVGKLRIVDFDPKAELFRDAGSTFRTDATSRPVANPIVASGSLEQSNVSVVERVAELSDVNQSFQALLRAVSVLMNDVDRGAITELGRR